ncbi:MAG TPA: hypothetical protein VE844_21045, partial [Gammaproteobacteria bacterium]|nr:hypothetical protein [Gammaproteobacteria bacterium]
MGRTEALSSIRSEVHAPPSRKFPPHASKLEDTPEVQALCTLAFVETADGFRMGREGFVRHHHSTTHKTRHVEEKIGAVLVHLLKLPPNVPGHPLHIVVKQDIEILSHVANLGKRLVPEILKRPLCVLRMLTVA